MESILNRQLIGASVLPLERGGLNGVVQILPLVNIALVLIYLNKKYLFVPNGSLENITFRLIYQIIPRETALLRRESLLRGLQFLGLMNSLKILTYS